MSTLLHQLQKHATTRPGAIALRRCRSGGAATTITYADLYARTLKFAHGFSQQKRSSPIIPMLLGKTPECVAVMLGAVTAGFAFACLNRKFRLPQISRVLEQTGPALALLDGPGVMTLSTVTAKETAVTRSTWRVIADDSLLAPHRGAVEKLKAVLDIDYWSPASGDVPPSAALATDAPACCLFTSGSTGTPKGVLISEADLSARAQAEVDWFELSPSDVLLSILPFSFDVGLNQLLSALCVGCELVLLDSWLPVDILKAAAEHQVTGISAVPAIWADMLAANMVFDTSGPHRALRYITLSGGDLPPDQLHRIPSLAPGAGIHKTYGQSEAFRATALRPHEFMTKSRSVGRAFTGVRVYIVRDDGSLAAADEEGEIIHTGLGLMLGYLGDTDSGGKLRPNPFRGPSDPSPHAIFTGDNGHLDADGFLYVHGRRDAMLKIAGNRAYPAEISAQIVTTPGVAEAEVIGVKNTAGETVLVAFIARKSSEPSSSDFRRELALRLPSFMIPKYVIELPAIPRTASGKPDRALLTKQAEEKMPG